MKIDKVIRDAYSNQYATNGLIQKEVKQLTGQFEDGWHFISRLKSEESFAQKVEAGLANEDLTIDDFYACTIVVRNSSEVGKASRVIESLFHVNHRRPASQTQTRSRPTEFLFDDLRLYCTLKPSYLGKQPIHDVIFEIQIKTFLQHAWGIATHDLTYKTDEVTWSKLRVASQIRAMLEHAELSIEQFDRLAKSEIIDKEHEEFLQIDFVIQKLRQNWHHAALPRDLQRLAKTIRAALDGLDVPLNAAFSYLEEETRQGGGATNLDLSPFVAILDAIFKQHSFDAAALSRRRGRRRYAKIVIPRSIEIPSSLESLKAQIFTIY